MKKRLFLTVALVMMAVITFNFTTTTSAHSIDYLAAEISPAGSFNGNSGNFTVTNQVTGGSDIEFSLTFSIKTIGNTANYPVNTPFTTSIQSKPSGASDPTVSSIPDCNFTQATGSGSLCTNTVTIGAPTTPGAYTVKIKANAPSGKGLSDGNGVTISFTVANPAPPPPSCTNAETSLSLSDVTVIYHQSSANLTATITSGGKPLSYQNVNFSINGTPVDSSPVQTDIDGVATLNFDSSSLSAGNHIVIASFAGDGCDYAASDNAVANISVNYRFIGFQQPINADGSSFFSGKVVPVKIRITDAFGVPVPDAVADLFFERTMDAVIGTTGEQTAGNIQGDSGNLMRYDATAGHYIFNWNVGNVSTITPNGTYTLRVGLGEGNTSEPHTVVLSLNRKK